jgi:hypothetical protein
MLNERSAAKSAPKTIAVHATQFITCLPSDLGIAPYQNSGNPVIMFVKTSKSNLQLEMA